MNWILQVSEMVGPSKITNPLYFFPIHEKIILLIQTSPSILENKRVATEKAAREANRQEKK